MIKDRVKVSVCCTAYNHEKYIREAIQSFLMQKTSFLFEIIIHDDASTDRTADIIRNYETKYPHIIRTILQKENQYSKGVKVGWLTREKAQGKYIAVCEGDDYWSDPSKLQKQVEYMEAHPHCSLCVHASQIIAADTGEIVGEIRPSKRDRDFSTAEVIEGGGGVFATNTMMYQRRFISNRPSFIETAPAGDYPTFVYLSFVGEVHYIDRCMSVYRTGVEGSWTKRVLGTPDTSIEHYYRMISLLDDIDIYSCGRYQDSVAREKRKYLLRIMQIRGDSNITRSAPFRELLSEQNTLKRKFSIFLYYRFPRMHTKLLHFILKFSKLSPKT